jgi:hypothetical protein
MKICAVLIFFFVLQIVTSDNLPKPKTLTKEQMEHSEKEFLDELENEFNFHKQPQTSPQITQPQTSPQITQPTVQQTYFGSLSSKLSEAKDFLENESLDLGSKIMSSIDQISSNLKDLLKTTKQLFDESGQFPLAKEFPNRKVNYSQCQHIGVIENTCIELYFEEKSTNLGIRLIIRDRIVLDQNASTTGCLDEIRLVKLVAYIPMLIPFKKLIRSMMKFYGQIPVHFFGICIKEKSGEILLDTKLICFRGNCLQKGEISFGKFNL